ncbi:trifunctional serine/threonine-protein kinase/ATP-binding protein/sensor histidine kinase [Paraburkholderia humisilvae]|uniref:histidine kinase n=1 Tax=Paraburkholderia humisilvae TaxID=627669 RepID=A0A6J5DGB7_9BURK|nr:ATP-binding sensor histidine kinase [Paraburkholderia humisilvae]CAB3752494.1 Adaptive-response sensory-kinase SasA [Paraburkholderia humisilvae]
MAIHYEIDERLRRRGGAALYRGKVGESEGMLIAVGGAGAYPTMQLEALRHEYALRADLDNEWAAVPVASARYDDQPSLLLKDPGGQLLRDLCGKPLPLDLFLPLAAAVAAAVEHMHMGGLIHLRIGPDNLLVETGTESASESESESESESASRSAAAESSGRCHAWLTGFGFAQRTRGGTPSPCGSITPEAESFAYLSPEQIGMPHQPADARTDLYALGCTFYELLTGAPPITATDPLEWAHAHTARQPPHVRTHRPSLPEPICAIVMKLLEKAPSERYQSAASLRADLERSLNMWRQHGTLEAFPLNLHDIADRLARSTKLYARQCDLKHLDSAFGQSRQGAARCVFVCGTAGSGKSALVHEHLSGLSADMCWSAASKCEPATQGVPYASLTQALDNLVRPLLGATDAEFDRWRARLQSALRDQGRALLPLMPDLERIVGPQPALPPLPPQAEKDRFLRVVGDLLRAFASAERPVVLFIDDLQWSDDGTLSVLEYLALRAPLPYLLVIGSFRDDEIAPSHPLHALAHDEKAELIALQPLTVDAVAALLADLLNDRQDRVLVLARLIVDRTYGNPFFTIQFISTLAQEGLITFQLDGRCTWDPTRIEAKGYTNNVVDLLLRQIDLLPAPTRDLMVIFSCLGGSAPANTIAVAADVSVQTVHDTLSAARDAKLIQCTDDAYAFTHDRILETTYLTLSDPLRRTAMHLRIGRRLRSRIAADPHSHSVFEVVNHLNRGVDLIDRAEERDDLAALNLQAGLQAKSAMAYADALAYLRHVAKIRSHDPDHPMLQTAAFHLAECEFITGHLDEAETRLCALAQQPVDLPFAAEITALRAALYVVRDRPDLAVQVGLQYLHTAGVDLPACPSEAEIEVEYQRLTERLRGRTFDEFKVQPTMSDPVWRGVLQVLADLIPPAAFTTVNLSALIALHMARISFEHGVTDASCYGYVCVSEVFRRFNDYQACHALGELAMHLVDARGFERYKARVHLTFGVMQSWTRPVRDALPHIRGAFEEATQAGDLTFAAYCRRHLISPMLVYGAPLAEMQQLAYESLAYARGTKIDLMIDAIRAQITYIDTLRGAPPNDAWSTDDEASRYTNRPKSAFAHWTHRMQCHFLFGDLAAALDAEARASALLWSSGAHFEAALFVLFSALVHAAAGRTQHGDDRERHLGTLKLHQQQLDIWARNAPSNYRDGATLVAAEIARIEHRVPDAMRLYEDAIDCAREQRFLHNEALANELAAQFHAALGAKTASRSYLRHARQAYVAWGADAKVAQLDAAYPELATPRQRDAPVGLESQLDVRAVIMATHALSREIVLTRLVKTLMRCTLEHAGGQRCVLVMMHGDAMEIEAEAKVSGATVDVDLRSGAAGPMDLPLSLARTVIRTGEMRVLDDARAAREWSGDAYVRAIRPRSVLCLPLLNQSRMVGLLYIENNLAPGAFTQERTSVLAVLSTHAAISLENARLYAQLIEESAQREQVAERLRTTQAELARTIRLTTMGELVASIVHEVNQPLSAAKTGAEAALRWLNRAEPEVGEARCTLDRVAADTTRAAMIVRGLLSLAKKSPPEMKRFDLNESMREVLQLLHREIAHHDVEIDARAIAGELAVLGDRVQLQQVVLNLVVNAMEAMTHSPPESRTLRLSAQPARNGRIRVCVVDTGPGVDPTVQEKVFEPFVTTKNTGMGMGLSICRSIIEAHGGELTVSANVPYGACFEFTVAAAD